MRIIFESAIDDAEPRQQAVAKGNMKTVINVGSGTFAPHKLHASFSRKNWQEVRVDIDPGVKPDIVADLINMSGIVGHSTADAIWSSHSLEHLRRHEVPAALAGFVSVLKPTGFCLIRCPDIETICELILQDGIDTPAYISPAGPITPLEMLYGHGPSIERGDRFMEHKTGFTADRLGRVLLEAGFEEVRVSRHHAFDLWAVAFMPKADIGACLADFAASGLPFDEQPE